MKLALLMIYAFLSGSIPFGQLIAKTKGIDLTTVGSRNIGATNVMRSVGKTAALFALLGDVLKGVVPVAIGHMVDVGLFFKGIIGLLAVAGHIFSPFLKFRGGKGVATGFGVLLIYVPEACIVTFIIWLLTVAVSRLSSLGAIVSFGLLPIGVLLLGYSMEQVFISSAITLLIIIRHTENIKRLIKGTERRIGEKP